MSDSTGIEVHHPGPLLFDALALPVQLLGSEIGVPLAVGGVNALCAWWIVRLAGGLGGLAVRLSTALAIALLTWTMTWPLLVEPWNPHAAMMPALLFFVGAGALALGEPKAALPAVVGLSLALQTHISYLYIIGFTLLATLAVWVLNRRTLGISTTRWSRRQRVIPLLALGALWVQPALDLILHRGESNLAALLDSAGRPTEFLAPVDAMRLVAAVVAVPPWWLPAGFDGPAIFDPPPPALLGALALSAVITALVVIGWRGPTRSVQSFARVPLSPVLGFSRNQWRWLWLLSLLVTLVFVWTLIALLQRYARRVDVRVLAAMAVTACACATVLNLNGGARALPVEQQERTAISTMIEQLPYPDLQRCRAVAVDYEPGFGPPALVAPSVMLALRERNISFVPTAADSMAHLDRRPTGDEDCQLTLSEQPQPGRLVGSLTGPLALGVTFTTLS